MRGSPLTDRDIITDTKDLNLVKQSTGSIWPRPQAEKRDLDTVFTLAPSRFVFKSSFKSRVIDHAFKRYRELIFPDKTLTTSAQHEEIVVLQVSVTEKQDLDAETDEGYNLAIYNPTSVLQARSIWGVLRGLETFSQLVFESGNAYLIHRNVITDFPRFKYRGFLIDTSRHYLPKHVIYQFLDAMSYSKFNVLHWHVVDDPSFPYVSEKFPELHQKGSYNARTHVYTAEDVKDIVWFARNRGIRVLAEFDTPGHTHSWRGVQGLLTKCETQLNNNEMFGDKLGPINPVRESTYDFLKEFLTEVVALFPDKYIHLGGDEVDTTCWESSPEIQQWLYRKQKSGVNITNLQNYFMQKLMDIVDDLGKTKVVWQDVFESEAAVDTSCIVEVWKDGWQQTISNVTSRGHKAILASCWYLDRVTYGLDWPDMYKCDPHAFTGTLEQKQLVIGGSAAIWGEYIDATNIVQRSFGRGFAVAERLWSSKETVDEEGALIRIREHQCRYLRRGIPAEPVTKSTYCNHEWDPLDQNYIPRP